MSLIAAIVAGLIATLAMTALMYMAPMMGMPKMDIVGMLGSMFSRQTATNGGAFTSGSNPVLGWMLHLMMGAVFGAVYALLWNAFGLKPSWHIGLIFGMVHGLITPMLMPMMVRMHPNPPQMESGASSTMGMALGHALFGLVVALVYRAMA